MAYTISKDKGKAQQDMKKPGPGPVRGKSFGKTNTGPKQGEAKPQPVNKWGKQGEQKWAHEGDGDANCGKM
jgi:hypothetical protein